MSWTPNDPLWKQAWLALKDRGPNVVFQNAVKRCISVVWEQATIIELCNSIESEEPFSIPKLRVTEPEVKKINKEELPILSHVTSKKMYRYFEQFSANDYDCFVALIDEKPAAYNWFTKDTYTSPVTRITFPLNSETEERFLIYSHTIRTYRGHGIDSALKVKAFNHYRKKGIKMIRTAIEKNNRTSFRMMYRWGAIPYRQHRYRRFLCWHHIKSEPVNATSTLLEELIGRLPKLYKNVKLPEINEGDRQ